MTAGPIDPAVPVEPIEPDPIAEVLAAHRGLWHSTGRYDWTCLAEGCEWNYAGSTSGQYAAIAAHQAAAVRAVLGETTTERHDAPRTPRWGVLLDDLGSMDVYDNRSEAEDARGDAPLFRIDYTEVPR